MESGYPAPQSPVHFMLLLGACPQLPRDRDLLSQGVSQVKPSCPGLAWSASLNTGSPGPKTALCSPWRGAPAAVPWGALAMNPFGVPLCQAVPQLPGLLSPELRVGAFCIWAAGAEASET